VASKYPQYKWDEARAAIEDGESENATAIRFGIKRSTLRKRIQTEHWITVSDEEKLERKKRRKEEEQERCQYEDHPDTSRSLAPSGEVERLIALHKDEWKDIEDIRKTAVMAFKNDKFKPADAGDKWTAKDRLSYSAKLFSMYNTASNALMVSQEAQRRAHGFDFREQMKQAKADGADKANQARLMDRLMASLETITNGKIVDGEWYEHTHDGQGAAGDQSVGQEGIAPVSDLGSDWPVVNDGRQDPRA
jgi:hypothetical protein